MCDFKPGDEVVCVDNKGAPELSVGATYTVTAVLYGGEGLTVAEADPSEWWAVGYWSERFREVNRRNSRLTIEAFMTMPGGFEEPKRKSPTPTRKEKA